MFLSSHNVLIACKLQGANSSPKLSHRSHITSAIKGIHVPTTQFFATIFARLYFDSIAVDTILARDVAQAVKNSQLYRQGSYPEVL